MIILLSIFSSGNTQKNEDTLVVAIADLKMIRIKIIFKRILQKHKTRFF